jgi:SpoVK/Ycf46/Vps4 family AAA+-type ATPase
VSVFLARTGSPVVLDSEGIGAPDGVAAVRIALAAPTAIERRQVWGASLGPAAARMNGALDAIADQFRLDVPSIHVAGGALRRLAEEAGDDALEREAWRICREHARRSMEQFARRIESKAQWDDLVLPEPQTRVLHQVAVHLRQRATVHERWGFAAKYSRGLGLSALFSGASGTGKTMAAEVLAHTLGLDLFQIDLAGLVSKYIGETEKNLKRVFDAAEESGAILLFDEADALFGKRTEVKDSHDRYANLEVSYLLQRMEAYRGLAILTTNMRQAIDTAFLRRIRFMVEFPFPDAAHRARIWRRVFPAGTPTADLDPERLAHLNITGGIIRNIAILAAFLAADEAEPVRMAHLLDAARTEYAKLERPLGSAEREVWQ